VNRSCAHHFVSAVMTQGNAQHASCSRAEACADSNCLYDAPGSIRVDGGDRVDVLGLRGMTLIGQWLLSSPRAIVLSQTNLPTSESTEAVGSALETCGSRVALDMVEVTMSSARGRQGRALTANAL
jgi:hypothetical protein